MFPFEPATEMHTVWICSQVKKEWCKVSVSRHAHNTVLELSVRAILLHHPKPTTTLSQWKCLPFVVTYKDNCGFLLMPESKEYSVELAIFFYLHRLD